MSNSDNTSNNKRIAKNTIMLYLRMFLTMIVGLYTSRVVLATLGVEDYGIYGVVGGVVGMLGFLNASMSGATSRFIAFEIGRGDKVRLAKTFSSAMIVHLVICAVVVLAAETVGLWFLCNKLIIPEERMYAAHVVYQLSIFSTVLGITQVPYNSCIIAHEKMDVYAYVEILNVTLKLAIVYLITIGQFDKLIFYSILMFVVSLVIIVVYRVYCVHYFNECKFHYVWDKDILKKLSLFSINNLFANFAFSIREQGNNVVLNLIFGLVANTACSIANTVNSIVNTFAINIQTAFRPQIIKNYSSGNLETVNSQILSCAKYSTLLVAIIVIPVEFRTKYLLGLWLGQVPAYAVSFTRILLISLIMNVTGPILIGLQATGYIKRYSIIQGCLYSAVPFLSYILCRFTNEPELAFVSTVVAMIISGGFLIAEYMRLVPSFNFIKYIKTIVCDVITCIIFTSIILYLLNGRIDNTFRGFIFIFCLSTMSIFLFSFLRLTKEERAVIQNYLTKLYNTKIIKK